MLEKRADAAPAAQGRLDHGPSVAVIDIGSNSVRLVVYEGPDYRIAAVEVRRAGGGTIAAEVFVPAGCFVGAGRTWDLVSWQRRHKRRKRLRPQNGTTIPT